MEYEKFKAINLVVDEIHIPDETAKADALKFCISHLGRPYGFFALLAIFFQFKFGDGKNRIICSELVARALKLNINYDMATPRQIRESLENKGK